MNRGKASPGNRDRVVERVVVVRNQRGLHARAAARMVEVAGRFRAEITVARCGQEVSGRSILGLMMLAAGPLSEVTLKARGADAVAAIEALARLIENKFEED